MENDEPNPKHILNYYTEKYIDENFLTYGI